jgi:hypothetical protein
VAADADQQRPNRGGRNENDGRRSLPATSCPSARFLNQRLEVFDALLEITSWLELWPGRRPCDLHSGSSQRMAPC